MKTKGNKINIDLYIMPRLNIRIDVDKYLSKYKNSNINNIIKNVRKDTKLILSNKKTLLDFLKYSTIRNVKFFIYYDYLDLPNIYIYESCWIFLSTVKYMFNHHTKKVKKEDYNLIINTNENDIELFVDLIIPLYSIIIVGIKNLKNIYKGAKEYGTSN